MAARFLPEFVSACGAALGKSNNGALRLTPAIFLSFLVIISLNVIINANSVFLDFLWKCLVRMVFLDGSVSRK